ncbi:hypothetical protein [Nonomuraea longicatena]
MRSFAMFVSTAALAGAVTVGAGAPASADDHFTDKQTLLHGSTTASYYWDDGSGRNGDTGMPASGKPMQKGLAASPSWPLLTEGYVVYKGKKMPFFVGDRGPGIPSNRGIMLDLDAKTFADLTGGTFNSRSLTVDGVGGQGHIKVDYVITKWGPGVGKKNHPVAFATGAWGRKDHNPAKPPVIAAEKPAEKPSQDAAEKNAPAVVAERPSSTPGAKSPKAASAENASAQLAAASTADESRPTGVAALAVIGGLALLGGGLFIGRDRLRKVFQR